MALLRTISDQTRHKSDRKMQATLLLIILLNYSGWTDGLCYLENATIAHCNELEDVKYIETYELESLKAPVTKSDLHPGYFTNLTSLRHLDLSRGDLERIEPGAFRKLINLRSLNLAENRIEYLELGSVDGLNHLHSLNLRKNNIQQLPPALARLKVLKHIDVQANPIQCNCATLRVRDLIVKRGVKFSKKVLCAGPGNTKGTSLSKPDSAIVCRFEEQDREMQNDQTYEEFEDEYGSGDIIDSKEYTEIPNDPEIETPVPRTSEDTVPAVTTEATSNEMKISESTERLVSTLKEKIASTQATDSDSLENTSDKDEELSFDLSEEKERTPTVITSTERKKIYKDALFHPIEGSGDEEEGSGEGSGTDMIFGQWTKIGNTDLVGEKEEESSSSGLIDMLFDLMWSTKAPSTKKDPDLEEEQFIDASSTKEADEETVVPKIGSDETVPSTTEVANVSTNVISPTNLGAEVFDDKLISEETLESSKVKDESNGNDQLAKVSPTKQSKEGMGSYVVLAALVGILAILIGFAAYKDDFCRKKRKHSDVENGTELKDMQEALLETGNSTQVKISSNGNVENVPLVEDTIDHEEIKALDDRQTTTMGLSKSSNGISEHAEPVKPPRASSPQNDQKIKDNNVAQDSNSLNDDSLSVRISPMDTAVNSNQTTALSEVNGPPLSPGAQRVKITLQENPDSVPRTPILITRTMAGENLVKTP